MFTAIPSFCNKTMYHWNVLLSKVCFFYVHNLLNVTIRDYITHTLVSIQIFPKCRLLLSLLKTVHQQKQRLIFGHKQLYDNTYILGYVVRKCKYNEHVQLRITSWTCPIPYQEVLLYFLIQDCPTCWAYI